MHSFQDPLRRGVSIAPSKAAVVCGEQQFTFQQLDQRVHRLSAVLQGFGLDPGDRVAIIANNCHRYVEVYLAVPANGLVLVPLSTRSTNAEVAFALLDANVKVVFTDRDLGPLPSSVEHVIDIPHDYDELIDMTAPVPFLSQPSEETLAGLFYTGGTTGRSKGVMLTHGNLLANAWTAIAWTHLREEDRWLVMAPMFHAAGTCLVLASLWLTSTQIMLGTFSPSQALDLIEHERATGTLAVPTMMLAMNDTMAKAPRDVSSLRLLSHGASPAPLEILKVSHQYFPEAEMLHLYGTTETSPIASIFPHEEGHLTDSLAGSIGVPAVGVDLTVLDPDDQELGAGEVGEIAIRGNNVMKGYWNLPEESERALRSGWYHTGDLGYRDSTGYFFLIDRLKDMVVTGGENVYTIEVEDALYRHPKVQEAAVFGVPDPKWGEAVHAVVVPREEVTPEELLAFLRTQIASHKLPKKIDLRQEPLPKSGAGKILKRDLREPFWAGHATRIGN
ncbi:AMP-binding protein [Ferrimicrobium sp.]|uniref:class I adenylate-forming enzyme family protein n=1 Tax=Ferrimicrobium sp. TaxID=2926050 RepID=UPI00261CDE58|nr:AMP-binding protein [Ferrimicrobium sp.]